MIGVLLKKNFSLKIEEIKKPVEVTEKLTIGELRKILEGLIDKPLGFEVDRPPPTKWLIKVIYSLNPNHEIFQPIKEDITKTIPKE